MLSMLQELEKRFGEDNPDIIFLRSVLLDETTQILLKVHQKLNNLSTSSKPHTLLLSDVVDFINQPYSDGRDQLSSFFDSSPHMNALMRCYDQILRKDYEPFLPKFDESELTSNDDEESMKVVRLVKGNDPLGATIALDESTNNIVFARILKGGPADRTGLIHVNDILVEVNKMPTKGKNPEELIAQLADFQGPLVFRLIPGEPHFTEKQAEEPMFVRAKFDYDPENDSLIPCIQAGLKFKKNDVLHIVSREDGRWWQAALVDVGVNASTLSASKNDGFSEYNSSHVPSKRAGLIPSAPFQNKREAIKCKRSQTLSRSSERSFTAGSNSSLGRKKGPWTLLRRTFRRPKHQLENTTSLTELPREFQVYDESLPRPIYEEVVLHHHTMEKFPQYRPLVLIGAQGVGRNHMKECLISFNPKRYGVPVPHTTRPKLPEEIDGKDYHFVSRDSMEQEIRDKKFIEYGEYRGNLYGTSISAVKAVKENEQVCVLTPYTKALDFIWNADLKPFTIFMKPSNMKMDVLNPGAAFSVDDLEKMELNSQKIESQYGHMFDYTIVCDDPDRAFNELLEVARMVENHPQWMPKSWQ